MPKAQAKSIASSGVMVSPTIPQTPEMLIFRSFMELYYEIYIFIFQKREFGL
jgi:hypothetical protein